MNRELNSKQMARIRALGEHVSYQVHGNPGPVEHRRSTRDFRIAAHQGATAKEILEGYTTLNEEMISLAPLYARAIPSQPRSNRRPGAREKVRTGSLPLDNLFDKGKHHC
jgi:uncharacterized protein (DUF433 family)